MNKRLLIAAMACVSCLSCTGIRVNADAELKKIRCTCYVEPGVTRSGHMTHGGVIAGRKEDLGKVAALYAIGDDNSVGEFLGYFDFYDTGAGMDTDGDGCGDSIIKGKSVDVFRNNMDDAIDWIKTYGDYVYIKIIEAEG